MKDVVNQGLEFDTDLVEETAQSEAASEGIGLQPADALRVNPFRHRFFPKPCPRIAGPLHTGIQGYSSEHGA